MRPLLLLAAIALTGTPGMAAGLNGHGIIRTEGNVTRSCDVGDADVALTVSGQTMTGTAGIDVQQNGRTQWTLETTTAQQGRSPITAEVKVEGSGDLDLTSTTSAGETIVVDGVFNERATVSVELTTTDSAWQQGRYQTQTTIRCVTQ